MLDNFNSIKVRLELIPTKSIERSSTFQFHKGTIRTHILFYHPPDVPDFNSIKVRLELIIAGDQSPIGTFQFHKGTIRTEKDDPS